MVFRVDHWAAQFDEATQWKIYYKIKTLRWTDAQAWLAQEYSLARPPGKSSIYEFRVAMREDESAHRLAEVAIAQAEAATLAKGQRLSDEETEAAYKQLATELALRTGSAKEASAFIAMAAAIADRRQKETELELKRRAQETKDEQLKLAREKFEAAERRENAARSALGDTKLTDAAKIAKMKEIFG